MHALELIYALKQLRSHILEHGQGQVVHIDEVVLSGTHHVLVLLVELPVAGNHFFVLSLLDELVIDVGEDVVPHGQRGVECKLATEEHTKPFQKAEFGEKLESLQVLMKFRIDLSHHVIRYLVAAFAKGCAGRVHLFQFNVPLPAPSEPLIRGHGANLI